MKINYKNKIKIIYLKIKTEHFNFLMMLIKSHLFSRTIVVEFVVGVRN